MTATYEISLDVLALSIARAAYHFGNGDSAEGMVALAEAYPIAERLRCEAWTAELGVEHKPDTLAQAVEMIERMERVEPAP